MHGSRLRQPVVCADDAARFSFAQRKVYARVIVVKLGYLEPEIRAIAKRSMLVLTDGSTNEIFTRLEYKELPRPMYPFDKDMSWSPGEASR